jgi:antitoxin ParD1/3/4
MIRQDRDRQRLRGHLPEGASSSPTAPADKAWFDKLRERVPSQGRTAPQA